MPIEKLTDESFVEPLAVRPKSSSSTEIHFTVYLSSPLHLLRAELAVSQDPDSMNWLINKATLFKSHEL